MIPETDKDRIKQWAGEYAGDILLRYAICDHPMDHAFREFAEQFASLSPGVRAKKDVDAQVTRPTLFVGRQVAYQALPVDRELDPFLAILADTGAFADRIAPDVRQQLAQLDVPALVNVYVTPHCPFCPHTVSLLLGLAACSQHVRVTIIDGERFTDAAQKDRVSAAPTVILDDQFRWTGSVAAGELVTLMLDRDPANLGAEALRSMIEDGNADDLARMMIARKTIFSAFIDLLAHPRWSVRLGAMVTFETLAEASPDLADEIVNPLMAIYADADSTVQGDLLHVMGESGNSTALPFLASVAAGADDPEVRSAAEEAIEKLKSEH
ncbi:MAG: thioredoxin family protein [Desulfosarcina sp.]|jgi:alkyl hydroperoxide reductase subunit AhpF